MYETKKVVCKYTLFENVVQEYAFFGWSLTDKILLNRFGSRVPYGVTFSEDDLREKCSYELVFTRIVETNNTLTLNDLQNEYNCLELKPTTLSKKSIGGIVWLSILFIAFLNAFITTLISNGYSDASKYLLLLLLSSIGCFLIIFNGAKNIAIAKTQNNEVLQKKQKLIQQAKKILEDDDVFNTAKKVDKEYVGEKIFCKYCSTQIEKTSKFCNNCGKEQ